MCHLTSWLALHSINFTSFNLTCALLDSRWLRRAQLCMKSKCGMNRRSGHFLLLHIHIAASSSILILFISVLHARKRASRRSESDFHITCARSSPARADCAFLRRPRALYCFDAILIPHWIFPQIYVCNVFEFGKKNIDVRARHLFAETFDSPSEDMSPHSQQENFNALQQHLQDSYSPAT